MPLASLKTSRKGERQSSKCEKKPGLLFFLWLSFLPQLCLFGQSSQDVLLPPSPAGKERTPEGVLPQFSDGTEVPPVGLGAMVLTVPHVVGGQK